MKILLTGCRGQLGTAVKNSFTEHELTCTDFDTLDITSREAVLHFISKNRFDAVLNAAAYTQVDKAEEDPEKAFAVNCMGPENLAYATREAGIPIVHISTDYVFDGLMGRSYSEDDIPNPASVYGRSKLEGEKLVARLNPQHYIVRTSWLYSTVGQNFPKTMIALSKTRDEVRVVNDQSGSPTFAPHLARGLKDLLNSASAYGIRHMAGSGQSTWFELTEELYKILGINARVVPVSTSEFPRPAKRPPYSVLTSFQTPRINLPPWREGLFEFAHEWQMIAQPS